MTTVVPIVASIFTLLGTVISGALVYKASSNQTALTANQQSHTQQQETIEGLRSDIAELDNQRRAYYMENVRLLQTIERYRAWGYNLVRLLTDNGISDVPPEPTEK